MTRRTTNTPNGEDRQPNGNSRSVVEWRRRLKLKALVYKGGKCLVCQYARCARALTFHHLDPSEKEFNITTSGTCHSWERVRAELDKCVLLCGNCHNELHDGMIDLHPYLQKNRTPEEGAEAVRIAWPTRSKTSPRCACGNHISATAHRCASCATKARSKVMWPSRAELIAMTDTHGFEGAGRALGVTGNGIRRRLRDHPE